MKFRSTTLADAMLIDVERRDDERGFFARILCRDEFAANGLVTDYVQSNYSRNDRAGTLRGMHRQRPPHEETKIVRCVRGALYDVIIDMRPTSPTYRKWEGFRLDEDAMTALYVPAGFAHGFITLTDTTDVLYFVSAAYVQGAEIGMRWNDPALGIVWPRQPVVMSEKDEVWPLLEG